MFNNKTSESLNNVNPVSIFPSWILFKYLFRRSFRQKSYRLFTLCLLISSLIMSLMGFFSTGVQSALNDDISQFLGAPLVISSDRALKDKWWQTQENFSQIDATITATFTYGVIGVSGYQSIGLKAVSANYPKKDVIKVLVESSGDTQELETSADRLKPFDVWLDGRALSELGLEQGDKLQIGRQYFNVAAEIVTEPDRLTQLQHLLPRVMIRMDDLDTIGLDLNSGRGEYRYLFDEKPQKLKSIEESLPVLIKSPYQVLKADSGRHPFSKMAQRSEKMLSLVMVMIMLMCGSAAALIADFAMKRFVMPATILRCIGLNKKSITRSMIMQLTMLTLISTCVGTLLGWMFQPLIKELLQPHLLINESVFSFRTPVITLSINALIIMTFIYPRLRAVGSVPIVNVLRGRLIIKKSLWISALAAFISVILLLWYFSDNTQLTLILSMGVTVIIILSVGFGWLISLVTTQFHRISRGMMKVVLRSLGRNPKKNIAPMATIALAVMGFLIINTLRGSFIDAYHIESLNQDGNLIFSRLPSNQLAPFTAFINNNNLTLKGAYPTVRAKLESINGKNIDQALKQESDTREEARSPVRLSWSKELPHNNSLIEGHWPTQASDGVSVESEVMSDLGLKIGDELGFRINDKLIKSKISSRRVFKTGASRMMFWFMFSPDTLKEFKHHYMGGIHINEKTLSTKNRKILSHLNAQFPQVLFTDLQQIVSRISDIMHTLMKIMSAILIILLTAAFTVLVASVFVSSQKHQQMLMRALGVSRFQLIVMNILQQGLIGLVSCLVGILGAQLVSGIMFDQLFSMPYQADGVQNLMVTIVITSSFIIFGLFLSYNILTKPILINQLKHNS